jgi:hypothetical protein
MPYKNPNSPQAIESCRKRAARYYEKHREKATEATMRSRRKDPTAYQRAQNKFKESNPDYFKKKSAEHYAKNSEQIRGNRKSVYCENPERERENTRRYYRENREEILMKQKVSVPRKEYHKKYYRELKQRIIAAYGGKCECCLDSNFEFLTIDHINGGGTKDRIGKAGAGFYAWLEKNGFPKSEYRLLCMNCNFAMGKYGHCPHKSTNRPETP